MRKLIFAIGVMIAIVVSFSLLSTNAIAGNCKDIIKKTATSCGEDAQVTPSNVIDGGIYVAGYECTGEESGADGFSECQCFVIENGNFITDFASNGAAGTCSCLAKVRWGTTYFGESTDFLCRGDNANYVQSWDNTFRGFVVQGFFGSGGDATPSIASCKPTSECQDACYDRFCLDNFSDESESETQ